MAGKGSLIFPSEEAEPQESTTSLEPTISTDGPTEPLPAESGDFGISKTPFSEIPKEKEGQATVIPKAEPSQKSEPTTAPSPEKKPPLPVEKETPVKPETDTDKLQAIMQEEAKGDLGKIRQLEKIESELGGSKSEGV